MNRLFPFLLLALLVGCTRAPLSLPAGPPVFLVAAPGPAPLLADADPAARVVSSLPVGTRFLASEVRYTDGGTAWFRGDAGNLHGWAAESALVPTDTCLAALSAEDLAATYRGRLLTNDSWYLPGGPVALDGILLGSRPGWALRSWRFRGLDLLFLCEEQGTAGNNPVFLARDVLVEPAAARLTVAGEISRLLLDGRAVPAEGDAELPVFVPGPANKPARAWIPDTRAGRFIPLPVAGMAVQRLAH